MGNPARHIKFLTCSVVDGFTANRKVAASLYDNTPFCMCMRMLFNLEGMLDLPKYDLAFLTIENVALQIVGYG